MPKPCTKTGCKNPLFAKGYCKNHQYLRSDRKVGLKPKKEKLIPLPRLLKLTEAACNRYIRLRDEGKPCVSCGSDKANQAGHYIAVNLSSFLRFDEFNINLQCPGCNLFKHGNPVAYRIELRKRIGEFELERLERDFLEKKVHKWSRQSLMDIKEYYEQKIKTLETKVA